MFKLNLFKLIRILIALSILLSMGMLTSQFEPGVKASPVAGILETAEVSAAELDCLFSKDCTALNSTVVSTFTLSGTTGTGLLQSRKPKMGSAGTIGAGLYNYSYQFDLSDVISTTHCISSVELDFGPIVPLDYDNDGELEHVYVVTNGGTGTVAPSSVEQSNNTVSVNFTSGLCGGALAGQGASSLVFGLASPFRSKDVTVETTDNYASHYDLNALAPTYSAVINLKVTPSNGPPDSQIRLVGSGYVPGDYKGTIRWDGDDVSTFEIPSGGAFSVPYTIPADATEKAHTITVCSGSPCTTGEFEQSASVLFDVVMDYDRYEVYLPYVSGVTTGTQTPEPFTYVVDSSVKPSQDELPSLDGATSRPLAAVKSPQGTVTTFVSDEIMVQTDDQSALDAFLSRTGGEVIYEVDFAAAGISGLAKMHLVRVDLSRADISNFTADITSLMDEEIKSAGEFAYSSEEAVQVFAMAAAEAVDGLTVAVNWLGETTAIPDDSIEAANGPGGYNSDAYTWAHFAQGTTQDIGVPEAWNLLDSAGRISNQVDIAILDGGFAPNDDISSSTTYISVIPFVSDPRNVEGFDDSSPWHGTDVLQTAMARSDNDYGVVGVAEPVGDPIAVFTSYDYVVSINSVIQARSAGADIINMSYSADVPTIFGWTVLPFNLATQAVRDDGVLLFASAGNDGINVDGENCFLGICWEHTWVTPCENSGVICVGGLAWDSRDRHRNSCWGAENVDIFAPYVVYGGWAPDNTGGDTTADDIAGTSFSSPYAASVAALIWAGDPSLSAGEVWTILRDTAHTSEDRTVNRYVNAYDAVREVIDLGATIEIVGPTDGSTQDLNRAIYFRARVNYVTTLEDQQATVRWRSNHDGELSTYTHPMYTGEHTIFSTLTYADLSEGTHTITVDLTIGSLTDSDTIVVEVENSPPTNVTITNPLSGAEFCENESINFIGEADDINETLPTSAFAWRSNLDGSLGTGNSYSDNSLSVGNHTITLRVTDSGGMYAEDSILIEVLDLTDSICADRPPSAVITEPQSGAGFYADSEEPPGMYYATVDFTGLVDDLQDIVPVLSVEWESDETMIILSQNVSWTTGVATMTARLYVNQGSSMTSHTITLRVTDTDMNVTEFDIEIFVYTLY